MWWTRTRKTPIQIVKGSIIFPWNIYYLVFFWRETFVRSMKVFRWICNHSHIDYIAILGSTESRSHGAQCFVPGASRLPELSSSVLLFAAADSSSTAQSRRWAAWICGQYQIKMVNIFSKSVLELWWLFSDALTSLALIIVTDGLTHRNWIWVILHIWQFSHHPFCI